MSVNIYADNAATTKLDPQAFEAMKPFMLEDFANASQPYSFSHSSKSALSEARKTIAACINAEPNEIYFTSGGTESDNWAIKGSAFSDTEKRATITTAFEHHAVLHSCQAIEKLKYPVAYISPTSDGVILPKTLEQYISDRTNLVSVMYANNEIGSIQPIKELCNIAHKHGALFHTDAVQVIGHVKIDVKELGIDMLSASAHKFNGPKGIGFLYIRKGVNICPFNDGGSQEFGMRAGTENVASIVGMAVALKNNCDNLVQNVDHIKMVSNAFLSNLSCEYHLNGNAKNKLPEINSISLKGMSGESILHLLDLKGISISTGSACDSVNTQISHVLKSINLPVDWANGTIRISFGKSNTVDEAIFIAQSINTIVNKISKSG